MTTFVRRPTAAGQISQTKSRLYTIERRLREPTPDVQGYIAKWSLGGPLRVSTSAAEQHPTGGTLHRIYATLRVAGSTDTIIQMKIDDALFATLVFQPGINFKEILTSMRVSARSACLTASITQVGTGAADLAIYGEFFPRGQRI